MRLLLDTHALLWTLTGNRRLSATARAAVSAPDNALLISSVCVFEVATKHRLGKLPEYGVIAAEFLTTLGDLDHSPLPVSMKHASLAGALAHPHKDPFDRLLIAQALVERVPIVSNETLFDDFGVERIW